MDSQIMANFPAKLKLEKFARHVSRILIVDFSSPNFHRAKGFGVSRMAWLLTYHSSGTPKKRLKLMGWQCGTFKAHPIAGHV